MQLSPNRKLFYQFFLNFQYLHKIGNTLEKKDERQRLFVSEIIDCKKRVYLNAEKAPSQNTYGHSIC